jgi:hypothetical protein
VPSQIVKSTCEIRLKKAHNFFPVNADSSAGGIGGGQLFFASCPAKELPEQFKFYIKLQFR